MATITFHHPHRSRLATKSQRSRSHYARALFLAHDAAKSIASMFVLYCIADGFRHLIERLLP
jgi:hypothetical protein